MVLLIILQKIISYLFKSCLLMFDFNASLNNNELVILLYYYLKIKQNERSICFIKFVINNVTASFTMRAQACRRGRREYFEHLNTGFMKL